MSELITFGPDAGPCAVCAKPLSRACKRCRCDYYCSKEHQEQDWKRHRKGCGAVAVGRDDVVGRHLVAVRDIPVGTVLLKETPLVEAPCELSGPMVCVGCYSLLSAADFKQCDRCGWPVCSAKCSLAEDHRLECEAFQRAKSKLEVPAEGLDQLDWHSLATLRVYMASQQPLYGPLLSQLFGDLPEGVDAGEHTQRLQLHRKHHEDTTNKVVTMINVVYQLTWIPPKDLQRAFLVVILNAMKDTPSGPCPTQRPKADVRRVFAGHSLAEHSCAPNAFSEHRENGTFVLIAARNISRGEHISLSYLDEAAIRDTATRRDQLCNWVFLCRCVLCSDPTERGLHLGAWHCGYCKREDRQTLVMRPDRYQWRCPSCGKGGHMKDDADKSGAAQAQRLEIRMEELLERKGRVRSKEWESLISDALPPRGPLHPTHFVVLQSKAELAFRRVVDPIFPELGRVVPPAGRPGDWCRVIGYMIDLLCVYVKLYQRNPCETETILREHLESAWKQKDAYPYMDKITRAEAFELSLLHLRLEKETEETW